MALTPGYRRVWTIFDPVARSRGAEVAAIRIAIEEGGMVPVWNGPVYPPWRRQGCRRSPLAAADPPLRLVV